MLTKNDLINLDSLPHINNISLKLYKDFCIDILFKQRFHFYFFDGTDIIIEFREWGIYHMLSIHHIDYTIPKSDFFNRIDNGLDFNDFTLNKSIRNRFRNEKERITTFSCVYSTLRYGRVFYFPNRAIPNTQSVKVDYLIHRIVDGKGINLGIRSVDNIFVPLTILVSKASNYSKYIDANNQKVVSRLCISNVETNEIIENIIYSDNFIISDKTL